MNRRGGVLIEVLAAIVILAVSGLTLMQFLVAVRSAQGRQMDRESEMRRAERLLAATTLLSQRELEQRLGVRPVGAFLIWVDSPEPFLYRVGLSARSRPQLELLATLVYRRREALDEP